MGIMLYQMLSGRMPFAADSLTAMIFQHVYERPIPLTELSREIPEPFWHVVRCLLAKSPALRYASARQVRDDLVAAGQNRPLPSKADQIDSEQLWLPTPASKLGDEKPRIVHAPVLDDHFHGDIDYTTLDERNDFFNWLRSLFLHRGRHDALALEGTSQQADGAIAEYERRQKQLRALVEEGDSVLAELRSQPTSETDATSLRLLIEKQSNELNSMRVKLARVDAVLQQLRGQRAVLQARLKTARARTAFSGTITPLKRLRELQRHPAALAIPATLLGIAAVIAWFRFGGSQEEASLFAIPEISQNQIVDAGSQTVQSASRLASDSVERRFSPSGDGKLAVVVQHRGFNRFSTPSTTGNASEPAPTIWDLQSGRQIGELRSPFSATNVVMARDVSVVVGIGANTQTGKSGICVWEVATGIPSAVIESVDITEKSRVGLSPDGRTAYVTLGNPLPNSLGFIDGRTGELQQLPFASVVRAATGAAFSPTRNIGIFAVETLLEFGGPSLHVYDLAERRLIHSILPASGRSPNALAFSGDGKLLAVTTNGSIQILETETWSETKILQGAEQASYRLAVSSNGRYVAQARSKSVELWNIQSEVVTKLSNQSESLDIQFGDNDTLVVVSPIDRFSFFDSSTGQETLGLVRDER